MTEHLNCLLQLNKEEMKKLWNKGEEDYQYHEKYRDGWSPEEGYEAVLQYKEECGYCVVVYYYDGIDERFGVYISLAEL